MIGVVQEGVRLIVGHDRIVTIDEPVQNDAVRNDLHRVEDGVQCRVTVAGELERLGRFRQHE